MVIFSLTCFLLIVIIVWAAKKDWGPNWEGRDYVRIDDCILRTLSKNDKWIIKIEKDIGKSWQSEMIFETQKAAKKAVYEIYKQWKKNHE